MVREALRRYIEEREWKLLLRYGELKAKGLGIRAEDVGRLVDEYRAETG